MYHCIHTVSFLTAHYEEQNDAYGGELRTVDMKGFQILKVQKNCTLAQFLKDKELKLYIGCAYYEFIRDHETVKEGQQIILMDKVMKILFLWMEDSVINQ